MPGSFCRQNRIWSDGGRFGLLANAAAAQEIDTAIISEAEEPRRQRAAVVEGVELAAGLEERVLYEVLAISTELVMRAQ
jgi:hypothetical protein